MGVKETGTTYKLKMRSKKVQVSQDSCGLSDKDFDFTFEALSCLGLGLGVTSCGDSVTGAADDHTNGAGYGTAVAASIYENVDAAVSVKLEYDHAVCPQIAAFENETTRTDLMEGRTQALTIFHEAADVKHAVGATVPATFFNPNDVINVEFRTRSSDFDSDMALEITSAKLCSPTCASPVLQYTLVSDRSGPSQCYRTELDARSCWDDRTARVEKRISPTKQLNSSACSAKCDNVIWEYKTTSQYLDSVTCSKGSQESGISVEQCELMAESAGGIWASGNPYSWGQNGANMSKCFTYGDTWYYNSAGGTCYGNTQCNGLSQKCPILPETTITETISQPGPGFERTNDGISFDILSFRANPLLLTPEAQSANNWEIEVEAHVFDCAYTGLPSRRRLLAAPDSPNLRSLTFRKLLQVAPSGSAALSDSAAFQILPALADASVQAASRPKPRPLLRRRRT